MGGPAVVRVRLAEAGDDEPIARIQVAGWRAAYAEILTPTFLDGLDVTARASQWSTRIGPMARADSPTFVAVDDDGTLRGFAHTGPLRDDDLDQAGRAEVYTVYVDPGAWRRGIGSALMTATEEFWAPTDVGELTLWVFEDNAASRAFYERLGWTADGARQIDDFGGARPAEVRYRKPI